MDEKYFPEQIENKWQQRWTESGVFQAPTADPREKFYCLEMLFIRRASCTWGTCATTPLATRSPGSSASRVSTCCTHRLGQLRPARGTGCDQARRQPARLDRREHRAHARAVERLGISYDWSREIAAHRPDYYKWDQWFFLQDARSWFGLQESFAGQLVSERTDRAVERTVVGGICWRGTQAARREIWNSGSCASPITENSSPT